MRRMLVVALCLLLGAAQAADVDLLLPALRKAATITVRGETSVTVAFPPRDPPVRTARSLPPVTFLPALIRQNFDVRLSSQEPVAGRPTQVFTLTPKVGKASSWRLWIDIRWNVPLAYEERSADGSLARRAELLHAEKLQKRAVPLALKPLPGLNKAVLSALPGLQLPAGFQAFRVGQRKAGPEIILSDGVNVLVLVLTQKGVRAAAGVTSRKLDDGYLWLVGNLDAGSLTETLAGVRRRDLSGLGTFLSGAASDQ